MSIVGTPGVSVFDNDFAVVDTPQDTAYLISTTASMKPGQFRSYSILRDCDFAADGSFQRFGNDLEIEGSYPNWQVRRVSEDVNVTLEIEATSTVSHFAHMPKLYDHWSLLSRYSGTVEHRGVAEKVRGLCTFEYARGVGRYSVGLGRSVARGKLPVKFFTYQIINIDARRQLLLTQLLGPNGKKIHRAVYLRSLDDYGQVYRRSVRFSVGEYESKPARTPGGFKMRLPRQFRWYAETNDGQPLLTLSCKVAGDYEFGLGAGFVNWFEYEGTLEGEPVSGQGYLEYIDRL